MTGTDEQILVSSLMKPLDRFHSNSLSLEKYIIETFYEILKKFYQMVFELKFLQNLNWVKKNQGSVQDLCRNY